ncbi:MAG: phosphatase PAP2 family protein [Nitrococcus sp.]|nr:phosphatase PAP2 family protein [Nitrococcus sp.]
MSTQTPPSWQEQLWQRLHHHWLLKTIGITTSISAFMVLYIALQKYPQYPVTVMPRTALDAMVPFVPWAWLPYVSLWLYIGFAPGLLYLRGEMPRYVAATLLLAASGSAIFFFLPTDVPAAPIDWSPWPVLVFLNAADAGGNACPSLHVGFSLLTVIWIAWLLRRVSAPGWVRGVNIGWCALIVWSTLAIRQHVALDVLAGASLGAVMALLPLTVWPRRHSVRRIDRVAACRDH